MAIRTVYRIQSLFVGRSVFRAHPPVTGRRTRLVCFDVNRPAHPMRWFAASDFLLSWLLNHRECAYHLRLDSSFWVRRFISSIIGSTAGWVGYVHTDCMAPQSLGILYCYSSIISVPFYVGGHLVMGLVVALMYDVLVWDMEVYNEKDYL